MTYLNCCNNPYNLWNSLIDLNKINPEFAVIICEKLSIFDDHIKKIQNYLNNVFLCCRDHRKYNNQISELKIEINKIINYNYEIIL